MARQRPVVVERDGFRAEWFRRRSELEVDVYRIEPDGTRGPLVAELAYPKIAGIEPYGFFMREVVAIAKGRVSRAEP